jgi:prevent-host-death family protein
MIFLDKLSSFWNCDRAGGGKEDDMKTLTIGELKARFSEVLENVRKGQKIVISYGKKREKVAVIVPYSVHASTKERKLGLLKDRAGCIIHRDFQMSDEEVLSS